MLRRGDDRRRLAGLKGGGGTHRRGLIAVNDVLYHAPEQRDLQDVVTCIREGVTSPMPESCWRPMPSGI
jgi:error-prone DNA polymerase